MIFIFLPIVNYYRIDDVWSAYTVSGRRCKSGGKCSHKSDIGIWSCPVEDGDWDYCCRPDHRCGYSEGYSYPWLAFEYHISVFRQRANILQTEQIIMYFNCPRCYVGSVSREQWRPCNEVYFPYKERKRDAPHWPISYVHKRGPPIDTATDQFKPSSVDSSFEPVRFEGESVAVDDAKEPRILHSYNNDINNSSVLEFHVNTITFR